MFPTQFQTTALQIQIQLILNAYYVRVIQTGTSQILSYLILSIILGGRCYQPHFQIGKLAAERFKFLQTV